MWPTKANVFSSAALERTWWPSSLVEDLAALEALEDQRDIEAADAALAESDERIPYEKVRRELGL